MTKLETLVRPNILALTPYSSARNEFSSAEGVFLDANENPYGLLNRYPDPMQKELKQKISEVKSIPAENIFLGNGSDEIIDLCFRIFCEPGKDRILTFVPTYGMYEVSASINDIECLKMSLDKDFQIDIPQLLPSLIDKNLKMIFICSPNNPTGNSLIGIEKILEAFEGIVIVDEAYIDYSGSTSVSQRLESYPNLIVLQTLSKAWGLAASRIGIAFANEGIIALLNKIKPPYNISTANQQAALLILQKKEMFELQKKIILEQKQRLISEMGLLSYVSCIHPSETNFILVRVDDAHAVYEYLVQQNIIVRNRHSAISHCLRITVGNPNENTALLNALKNYNP